MREDPSPGGIRVRRVPLIVGLPRRGSRIVCAVNPAAALTLVVGHAPPHARLGWAALTLVLITLLLLLFVVALVLIALGRRRRHAANLRRGAPPPSEDAWREAGRRLKIERSDDQG
jgi:cbb3-type cytochrome oxidase subunit 3